MTSETRIIKCQYTDEFNKSERPYYIIQYRKSFLWLLRYWRNVTETKYTLSGSSDIIKQFDSQDDAERYIKREQSKIKPKTTHEIIS